MRRPAPCPAVPPAKPAFLLSFLALQRRFTRPTRLSRRLFFGAVCVLLAFVFTLVNSFVLYTDLHCFSSTLRPERPPRYGASQDCGHTGTWFNSRSTWRARTAARRAALLGHWNIGDATFPIRVENAALAPWLPFLGATADPSDADQLCLEQNHLEFYFLGAFQVTEVDARRVANGEAFVLPVRLNDAFEALINAGLDLTLDPRVTVLNGLGPTVFLSQGGRK